VFYQREFLIARLNKARGHLTEQILHAPHDKEIYPGWKLKEFVAHVTGWDDATVQGLRSHARGEAVEKTVTNGIDDYNEIAVAGRQSQDLDLILKEYGDKRLDLIQALRDLPDEKFNVPLDFPWGEYGSVAYMIEIFVDHEEELAEDLQIWLKNPDAPLVGKH
jgi:hypothetical protein